MIIGPEYSHCDRDPPIIDTDEMAGQAAGQSKRGMPTRQFRNTWPCLLPPKNQTFLRFSVTSNL